MKLMHYARQTGFTVTELLIVLAMLFGAGFFTYSQLTYFDISDRNRERRTAVNALHYYLKETYFKEFKSYPMTLNTEELDGVKKSFLSDPSGRTIGEANADLRYEPSDCNGSSCKRYALRADLEEADDFIRTSD